MRRCASMANDSSRSKAAQRFSNCRSKGVPATYLRSEQQVHEKAQHGKEKSDGQKLGGAKHAQLGRYGLDKGQSSPGHGEFDSEERNGGHESDRTASAR